MPAPAPTSETGNKINSTREGAFHRRRRRRHMHDYKAPLTRSPSGAAEAEPAAFIFITGGRQRWLSLVVRSPALAARSLAHCDSYGSWNLPSPLSSACCSLNPLPLSSSNSLTRSDSAAAGSLSLSPSSLFLLRCYSFGLKKPRLSVLPPSLPPMPSRRLRPPHTGFADGNKCQDQMRVT